MKSKRSLFLIIVLLSLFTFYHLFGIDTITGNQIFWIDDKLRSQNGVYILTLQSDGNLVLYENSKAIWSSGTNGKAVKYAVMQQDGNFVIYSNQNQALWSSKTSGNNGARLIIQNDGNVVIYSGSRAIWNTRSSKSSSNNKRNFLKIK